LHKVDGVLPAGVPPAVGYVPLTIIVGADGTVRNVEDQPLSDKAEFQAAVAAVKQWIYEPETANGLPRESRLNVSVEFPAADGTIPSSRREVQAKKQPNL